MDTLLPVGFYDLLSPKTHQQRQVLQCLLDDVMAYGYQLVEPPLMEFEQTVTKGYGDDVSALAFRVMDPQSHKMMAIRADMTPQISRIVGSRLSQEEFPLRLTYSGKVLRVVSDHFHAERELVQAGIELIGEKSAVADIEILSLSIKVLRNLGIKDLSIDITTPILTNLLLEDLILEESEKKQVIEAIQKKNLTEIINLLGEDSEIIISLLQPDVTLESISKLKLPAKSDECISRLKETISLIRENIPEVTMTIDPLGSQQFGYHTDIGFSIFSTKAKGELAKGGRYKIPSKDNEDITATGISFYINEIFRNAEIYQEKQRVFIPKAERSFAEEWQKKGYITVLQLDDNPNFIEEASRLGCDFICKSGELVQL